MRNRILACLALPVLLLSCQPTEEKSKGTSGFLEDAVVAAPCEFSSIDSVSAKTLLEGSWKLAGVKTTYMGTKPDEFLTGEQIEVPKKLEFFSKNEFVQTINGQASGPRQKYVLQDQSLSPLAFQFWFCGDNTLVLSNVAADGPVEVYVRQ